MPQTKQMPQRSDPLSRRQSAPQPTAREYLERMGAQSPGGDGAPQNAFEVLRERAEAARRVKIGREELAKANATLQKYKAGKIQLESRIRTDEEWYRLRHWEVMKGKQKNQQIEPVSAWLFNCIESKHADCMDNIPAPNILPREESDRAEAEKLTSILPVVLDQCDFEQIYSDLTRRECKTGTGVYGVFWDKSKHRGLGDITILELDLLGLFWEPGVKDIQKSRNFFSTELCDNEVLIEMYPQLAGKLTGNKTGIDITKYNYDDTVDTTDKSLVIDWYYKRQRGGRTVLHYCKYVGEEVLYASENDPEYAERGWYDHGLYPFVFDVLFPMEGTPAGFGYIDIGRDAQEYIDRGNQAILKNMLANAAPRYFVRADCGINMEEYADMSRDFVHAGPNLGQGDVMLIQGKPLDGSYANVVQNRIEELKETTGNRDINSGGTTSGVTAASAIAAMQEAGGKLSRDHNKASWRAFRRVCLLCIELIRQFYDTPRCFRIMGEMGQQRFEQYSNENLKEQHQGTEMGIDMGYRLPIFDVEVTAQKQSPYSKMSQNELALEFYNAGFFNPEMADQALACVDMMDFDRKHFVIQKISQNGTMYQRMMQMQQQLMQLSQIVDAMGGTNLAQGVAAQAMPSVGAPSGGAVSLPQTEPAEGATVKAARERVAQSTSPA